MDEQRNNFYVNGMTCAACPPRWNGLKIEGVKAGEHRHQPGNRRCFGEVAMQTLFDAVERPDLCRSWTANPRKIAARAPARPLETGGGGSALALSLCVLYIGMAEICRISCRCHRSSPDGKPKISQRSSWC
ncbi:MAG: hypothetical protein ACLSAP_07505 [Oscillospiraceae bacterium]